MRKIDLSRPVFISLVSISALILAACSSGQSVSYKSGDMTQTFVAGKDAGKSNFLLPIYPNSRAIGENKASADQEHNSFVMLNSSDPAGKIASYYKQELEKQGWTVDQKQMLPDLVNISARKDKLDGSVMISGDGKGNTTINLSVAVEPEGTPEVSTENFVLDKINPPTD